MNWEQNKKDIEELQKIIKYLEKKIFGEKNGKVYNAKRQ